MNTNSLNVLENRDEVPTENEMKGLEISIFRVPDKKRDILRAGGIEFLTGNVINYFDLRNEKIIEIAKILTSTFNRVDKKIVLNDYLPRIAFFLNTSATQKQIKTKIFLDDKWFTIEDLMKIFQLKSAKKETSSNEFTVKKLGKILFPEYVKAAKSVTFRNVKQTRKFQYDKDPILGVPNGYLSVSNDDLKFWLDAVERLEAGWKKERKTRFSEEARNYRESIVNPPFPLDKIDDYCQYVVDSFV